MKEILRLLAYIAVFLLVSNSEKLVGEDQCVIFSLSIVVIYIYFTYSSIMDAIGEINKTNSDGKEEE